MRSNEHEGVSRRSQEPVGRCPKRRHRLDAATLVSVGLVALGLTGAAFAQTGASVNLCADLGVQLPGLIAPTGAALGLRIGRLDDAGNSTAISRSDCKVQASSIELNTNKGISLGGGRIDGLGSGQAATAGDTSAVAIGNGSSASGKGGIALGLRGSASGADSVAVGVDAKATASNAVAIGHGSVADDKNTVSVGSANRERRIVNVANGRVAAGSTDAINGDQLHDTNTRVAQALGGGAGTNARGRLTKPSYGIRGRTYHDVGSALDALDSETTRNARTIRQVSTRVATNTADIERLREGRSGVFRADNADGAPAPQVRGANAVAGGYGALASGRSAMALGTGAKAMQDDTLAVGAGALAAHANSTAIGVGARTTRADQVAIGRAGQTYTLGGLDSAASRAAQSGTTRFVTTDVLGNIAGSSYGPSDLAALDGRVTTLENAVGGIGRQADRDRRESRQGVAAAMAMTSASMPSLPGRTTWALNGATFKGEWAGGAAIAHRLDTAAPLALTAGFSYSESSRQGARVGLTGEF